jgi:hypothetical protein
VIKILDSGSFTINTSPAGIKITTTDAGQFSGASLTANTLVPDAIVTVTFSVTLANNVAKEGAIYVFYPN